MTEFEFTCPNCSETMLVDEGARRLLLEDGCAVCGASPERDAFVPRT